MKKFLAILMMMFAIFFAPSAHAQVSNPSIVAVASVPGSCSNPLPMWIVISTGAVYSCQSGVPTALGGSGTFNALTGDATSTATGGATTVKGLEGVPFCTGFTPTNGQAVQYTTASSPDPCYTAAAAGGMVYPGAGVANSTGLAWGTSYTVGTGDNDLVQLNSSAQLPAVSAALLTNFPTLNQNTTGTAGGLSGTPNISVGTITSTGLNTLATTASECWGTGACVYIATGSPPSFYFSNTAGSGQYGNIYSNIMQASTALIATAIDVNSSTGYLKFYNGSAYDTGISRISAGVTGFGNGTAGDYSGTVEATNLTLEGSGCGAGTYAKADGTGCGTPSGSGTVNSGTAYSPTYYATTGTAVSGTTPFTGIGYWSTSAAPAAATAAQLGTLINIASTEVPYSTGTSAALAGSANLTWSSPTLTIGVAGTTTGILKLGSSTATGSVSLTPASAASAYTLTLPAITDTLVTLTATQTLTNKTLTSANLGGSGTVVPSGATLTIQSGGTLTCAAGSTCPSGSGTWTGSGTEYYYPLINNSGGTSLGNGTIDHGLTTANVDTDSWPIAAPSYSATGTCTLSGSGSGLGCIGLGQASLPSAGASSFDYLVAGTSGFSETIGTGAPALMLYAPTTTTTANKVSVSTTTAGSNAYIDFPSIYDVPAANCVSSTAGSGWSTTIAPACRAGTYNLGGNLPFADASTAQFDLEIPEDWDSATDPYVALYFSTGTNTSGTIIFQVQASCYTSNNSATNDVAFETAQVFSTITAAAANYGNRVSLQLNSTSMTGCVAGGSMILKFTRNTDTASATVPVGKAVVTIPRLITVQAN